MADRLQLRRDRAHDSHYHALLELRVNRAQTVEAQQLLLPHEVACEQQCDGLQAAGAKFVRLSDPQRN